MNVLFFSPYFYPYQSGLTRYPFTLFKLLKNHHFTVLTFAHKKHLPVKESFANLTIIRLPFIFKISKGFISLQSLKYFNSINYADYDGLILNLPNAEATPLASIAKRHQLPILSIYHCDVKVGRDLKSRFISQTLQLAVNYQLSVSDHVVTNTLDYAQSRPSFTRIQPKLTPILPPIITPVINPQAFKRFQTMKSNHIWLGVIGRLAAEKNIETIIQAIKKLNQPRYHLVFAGPNEKDVVGESAYAQSIKALLQSENIPNHQCGFIKQSDLGAFYQSLDALILASNNSTESLGLSQIEAMKVGTPVIASNLPGIRQPVTQTGMGELADPNDPTSIKEAIAKVINDKASYVTETNQVKALRFADLKATIQAYEDLFRRTFAL